LRHYLGGHAEQQGSKVDADMMRFDFTNHQAVNKEMQQTIEQKVNNLILNGDTVFSQEIDIDTARKTGAMMLFGEKYPEKVRVVTIDGRGKELCGGTHVKNTSEIGLFKIISEESVAAGIRRITALTGMKAVEKMQAEASILQQLAQTLKVPAEEMPAKVSAMQEQVKKLQKQLKTQVSSGKISIDDLIAGADTVGNIKVILWDVPDMDINGLRQLADAIRAKTDSVAMLFSSVQEEKVTLVAGLSRDLVERKYDAVAWIRSVSPIIGGRGGGGRPDLGQGGGNDPAKLQEMFAEAKKFFG
jgi:alanyl-tRNA synthetase